MEIVTKKIIPIVVKLACDMDNLVQQLFEPLAIGVVHYFASGIQYNSIYTPIIVDILMVNKNFFPVFYDIPIRFIFYTTIYYTIISDAKDYV